MKKFFIVALALGLCVAVAMPAVAKVSTSGTVGYDIKYDSYGEDDPSSVPANAEDNKGFEIQPQTSKAQIRFDWEAGPATPYIELAMRKYQTKWIQTRGGDRISDAAELRFGVDYVHTSGTWGGHWEINRVWDDDRNNPIGTAGSEDTEYYADIWWQVNPMLKLSFSDDEGIVGGGKGAEKIGVPGSWEPYIFRAEVGLPIGKLTVDFANPQDHGTVAAGGGTWMAAAEQNLMPAIGISLAAKLGPISVAPAYVTQSFEYERGTAGLGPAAGSDDGYTAWRAIIPVKANLGPIALEAQYAWGENISGVFAKDAQTKTKNGKLWAADVVTYSPSPGVIRFDDTEYTGWNIDAHIQAGIGKLSVGYGMDETDARLTATTRTEIERDAFYIKYAIPIGKGFTITPKYMSLDEGDIKDAGVPRTVGGVRTNDDDTHKLYTVNFAIRF